MVNFFRVGTGTDADAAEVITRARIMSSSSRGKVTVVVKLSCHSEFGDNGPTGPSYSCEPRNPSPRGKLLFATLRESNFFFE